MKICVEEDKANKVNVEELLRQMVRESAAEIQSLLSTIDANGKEIKMLTEVIRDLSHSHLKKDDEVKSVKQKLSELKEKEKNSSERLEKALKKLSTLSTKNASKREKKN